MEKHLDWQEFRNILREKKLVHIIEIIFIFQLIFMIIWITLILNVYKPIDIKDENIIISACVFFSLWIILRLINAIIITSKVFIFENINENPNINLLNLVLFSEVTSIVFLIKINNEIKISFESYYIGEWEEYNLKNKYIPLKIFIKLKKLKEI